MERRALEQLLQRLSRGEASVDETLEALQVERIAALESATLDLERAVRCGHPEVIFGQGKTVEQIEAIIERLEQAEQSVLATRLDADKLHRLQQRWPDARVNATARTFFLRVGEAPRPRSGIVVISAGTSDAAVAAEAVETAWALGCEPLELRDVGVAGLSRLLSHGATLAKAKVLIVVAGMEGALPSVVTGLTDRPVIGVPTSQGYGYGGDGTGALMAMLNACASGLTVVNIDNGFGAGYAAALMLN